MNVCSAQFVGKILPEWILFTYLFIGWQHDSNPQPRGCDNEHLSTVLFMAWLLEEANWITFGPKALVPMNSNSAHSN